MVPLFPLYPVSFSIFISLLFIIPLITLFLESVVLLGISLKFPKIRR